MAPSRRSSYFTHPHFPFQRAPELDGRRRRHRVAIVGGGPVGLTTALSLARHGVGSVVLEADETVAEGSRAVCISRRSMEILQQLGLADRFLEKGLGWTSGRSFYRGEPVFRLEMPHGPDERFHPMTNLQQCWMELYLAERIAAEPTIELRWSSRLAALEQDGAGVRLRVETPEGGYELEADYAVAADGARSTARQLMGLKLSGESYEGRYLIADIRMASPHPIERRAWFDPPSNPDSTVLVHKQPDDIWRIDYQLRDEDDPDEELEEAHVRRRIQAHLDYIGERTPWALEWVSLYKAHCLCLERYRHGRVLFAGDAAHLVPIFGVRGLNSGFADADNLGWKLAYALRGLADESILDSYDRERRAATLEIFREAGKSTRFMTPPTLGGRLMRDAALSLSLRHAFSRGLVNPRQSQPYDYVDSALNARPDREAEFNGGVRRGAALRNVRLQDGGFLLDRLARGFTGLIFADRAPAFDSGEVPFAMVRLPSSERRAWEAHDAVAGTFYLARPDGHVCARWRRFDAAEARAALRRATARA